MDAGLIYKVYHSSCQGVPLAAQQKQTRFKVIGLDIGLCLRLLGLPLSQLFMERTVLLANRGGIAEQFVAQELLSATGRNASPQLHYWHREAKSAQAEVDFVIERAGKIVPIEVKAGQRGRAKSLSQFLKEHATYVDRAILCSAEPLSHRPPVEMIPFYALRSLVS